MKQGPGVATRVVGADDLIAFEQPGSVGGGSEPTVFVAKRAAARRVRERLDLPGSVVGEAVGEAGDGEGTGGDGGPGGGGEVLRTIVGVAEGERSASGERCGDEDRDGKFRLLGAN